MPIHICDQLLSAVRQGVLYGQDGSREIAVLLSGRITPALLDIIQTFRGRIYGLHGGIPAVQQGRNIHAADQVSDHVVLVENGRLIGCARYERPKNILDKSVVELGGFVVDPILRHGRATLAIVEKVKQYAQSKGDQHFIARASVEFGSASILKKFGARVMDKYFDHSYQRNLELLEINLPHSCDGQLVASSLRALSRAVRGKRAADFDVTPEGTMILS